MDDKTRKTLLTLELLALFVSALLILIDYKLKRDLLALFIKIERSLYGSSVMDKESPERASDAGLRTGDLVGEPAGMEAPINPVAANGNSQPRRAARKPANSNGGAGGQGIPQQDKQVGP